MRIKGFIIPTTSLLLILTVVWATATVRAAADDQAEVRGVVRQVFDQLKSRQYSALYDLLPAASQRRLSRDRFTGALQRTSGLYELDRIEIGAVRVSGDIAVVDTTMYGRVSRPVESDGKIVAQQYLVREGGRWRVVVGDRATMQSLLADYPAFTKKYPVRNPRIYVKRDGRWVDVSSLMRRGAK
ncbi:MAG: hypothetical protein H0X14_03135 [Acidobacteria bacterium]|nr:hypothetical protein [Acidobacteriota bacterium]